MAVIRQVEEYSPQSLQPSDPSPISTTSMNFSTIEGWETPHTTTDDNTFYSEGELRRVYCDLSPNETFDSNEPKQVSSPSSPTPTPPPPPGQKRKHQFFSWFVRTALFVSQGKIWIRKFYGKVFFSTCTKMFCRKKLPRRVARTKFYVSGDALCRKTDLSKQNC